MTQEGEVNIRVNEVCETNIRIKGNEAWENRKEGLRSEYVYRLSYEISFFVSQFDNVSLISTLSWYM